MAEAVAQPQLWTTADFARYAKISPEQARKLRQGPDGPPFVRMGRQVRYVPVVVHQWVLKNQHTTTKENTK